MNATSQALEMFVSNRDAQTWSQGELQPVLVQRTPPEVQLELFIFLL